MYESKIIIEYKNIQEIYNPIDNKYIVYKIYIKYINTYIKGKNPGP